MSTGKKVGIRRQAKQGGTTPMLHIIVNSRRRENHGPPAQLHNESSDEGIFGDELWAFDVFCNRTIQKLFSKVLDIKI